MILTTCYAAKARLPLAERKKRQKEIDKLPPNLIINLIKK